MSLTRVPSPWQMSASENQAAEASNDTCVRKIGPTGNKIRIRLPPRKRLAGGLQTVSTGELEETKSHPAKETHEHTVSNTQITTVTDSKVEAEDESSKSPGDGQCEEASSNSRSRTLSKDKLLEESNCFAPCPNLTTTTGQQVEGENNCPVRKVLIEEGNKNIMSKGLVLEDSSSTPMKESCVGAIDNTPSKKLSVTRVQGEVEKNKFIMLSCEDASYKIRSKRLTNNNKSSKGVTKESTINNSCKNLATSAVKFEGTNDNSVGNSLFEEARNNIMTAKLSTEAVNCAPSRRSADPVNDKKSNKKLCTSVVHATETRQNTSAMKLSTSVAPSVEQSTSATNLEARKEYEEFEEKVKRTVYLDNLSLLATDVVIEMALNQFGNVRNVNFLVNYTVPYDIPQSALVEMETEKGAKAVVNMLHDFPFMMSGMPRPVRAKHATAEMFNDRPRKPGRKMQFHWVGPTDPDYHNVWKFKLMSKRHEVENLALIKNQMEVEEMLAKQQQNNLNCDYRKLVSIDTIILGGSVSRLSHIYNFSYDDMY